ncbi:MAG: hypothetical protein JHC88_04665 [Niveispirillum sp.]|nr:hypothetical protein [Niveispirillum sp.]
MGVYLYVLVIYAACKDIADEWRGCHRHYLYRLSDYIDYLSRIRTFLPTDCDITAFNIAGFTGLDISRASDVMGMAVQEVQAAQIPFFTKADFDVIIMNETEVARRIDDSIRTVFAAHGSSIIPSSGRFMHADIMAYFDVITVANKANMHILADGMSAFRKARRLGECEGKASALRSDMRISYLMPTQPVKKEKPLTNTRTKPIGEQFTIGIMPTMAQVIQPDVSFYFCAPEVIGVLFEKFPGCKIIFRPYPADLSNRHIVQFCANLLGTGRVEIDLSGSTSAEFFSKVDLLITDGSTGGVSFMLNRGVPPIYYVPAKSMNSSFTRMFADKMRTSAPVAHTPVELEECIRYVAGSHPGVLFKFYENYCRDELFFE